MDAPGTPVRTNNSRGGAYRPKWRYLTSAWGAEILSAEVACRRRRAANHILSWQFEAVNPHAFLRFRLGDQMLIASY